jgi:hypothetical protein
MGFAGFRTGALDLAWDLAWAFFTDFLVDFFAMAVLLAASEQMGDARRIGKQILAGSPGRGTTKKLGRGTLGGPRPLPYSSDTPE